MRKIIYRLKLKNIFKNRLVIFDVLLIIIAVIYYAQFLQRGIVVFDEGYMLHMSERVLEGQVPFRDFISQYSPGYLYLIAILFKIFGPSIIISRILSALFCIGILVVIFLILNEEKIKSKIVHVLAFLSIISFGYPLLNIATISWPIVFFSLLLVFLLLKYFKKPSLIIYLSLSLVLVLTLFFKQNYGIYFSILVFFSVLLNKTKAKKTKVLFLIFFPFVLLTLFWVYFLLIKNPESFSEFIMFNINFGTTFRFSYPSFSMLLEPFGIFKLIPYYLPPIFFFAIIYSWIKKKIDKKIVIICLFSLVGFFGLIYPASDLLHLYPFYGSVLVSLLIFLTNKRKYTLAFFIIILNVSIGFYLTFFKGYFRYYPSYRFQNTALKIERAENILIPRERVLAIRNAYYFIQRNTNKDEPILVYPTSPMFYFLFDRPNPSKDSLYIYPYSIYTSDKVLNEIITKKVRYIITDGGYKNSTILSKFILKQRQVFNQEQIIIFLVQNHKI